MSLLIRRLSDAATDDLLQVTALYEESIPASERKSAATLRRMLADPRYLFFAAKSQDDVVGYAIACNFKCGQVCLLEYMGVRRDLRSQGLGGAVFGAVADEALAAGRTLLLEVDSEGEAAPDLEIRQMRKRFYRRLGCRELLGLDYRMPQVGEEAPPLMSLMVYERTPRARVPLGLVTSWLQQIYDQVYGAVLTADALASMTARLSDSDSIELV